MHRGNLSAPTTKPSSHHITVNNLPALDLPGYGLSDKPLDAKYDYDFYTDVLNHSPPRYHPPPCQRPRAPIGTRFPRNTAGTGNQSKDSKAWPRSF